MKHTISIITVLTCLLLTQKVAGQEKMATDTSKKKDVAFIYDEKSAQNAKKQMTGKGTVSVVWNDKGLQVLKTDSAGKDIHKEKRCEQHYGIFDIGTNFIQDKTNYNAPGVKTFLNVPANRQNASLFDLRQSKSININIDLCMETFKLVNTKRQKVIVSTGLVLQFYNFRYENPITYTRNPTSVTLDPGTFKKDKLAFDYLNVPLMVTCKTKLTKKEWLIYGAGITGGYSIATWTKQISGALGKVKVHDQFDFAPFNSCVTAEIGITSLRFYASYQLTSMFQNDINQHPVCIGLRLSGI